jgi:hypothetical protein
LRLLDHAEVIQEDKDILIFGALDSARALITGAEVAFGIVNWEVVFGGIFLLASESVLATRTAAIHWEHTAMAFSSCVGIPGSMSL